MIVYLWSSIILAAAYLVLMAVYRYGSRMPEVDEKEVADKDAPFFSIIIPARNEQQNIKACLLSILGNDYPGDAFEVIVIDDFSEDDTALLARSVLREQDKVLYLTDHLDAQERLNAYKKKALEIGISKASGGFIITTDADCLVPLGWLRAIAGKLRAEPQVECLAAPVNFIPARGVRDWLYYFQSIDFMTMQGITIASNRLNLGNMSNGANFIFSKKAYEKVDGYRGIDKKASGDDMMLMQKIAQAFPGSIDFLFDKRAVVDTPVQPDWSSFLAQRIRWASKADSYPQFKMTLILLLVYLFNLNFLALAIAALFHVALAKVLLAVFLMKVLSELMFVSTLSKFFNKRNELLFLIILQPLHIVYIVWAGFLGKFGRYEWKGRTVT